MKPTCWFVMSSRDRADEAGSAGDAEAHRLLFNNPEKFFVLTLSFQAKVFLLLKLENVAFAM